MRRFGAALALAALCTAQTAHALGCARDAIVVLDGSSSMAGALQGGPARITEARAALARALPEIAPIRRVGLLSFGDGGRDFCSGIKLRVAPTTGATDAILEAANQVDPGGMTPLTNAVRTAAHALNYRNEPGIIVIVTDGSETCGGNPCQLGQNFRANAEDLTVHVIGFQLVQDPFTWNSIEAFNRAQDRIRCLTDQTDGSYVTAQTLDELIAALQKTLGCPVIGSLIRRTG